MFKGIFFLLFSFVNSEEKSFPPLICPEGAEYRSDGNSWAECCSIKKSGAFSSCFYEGPKMTFSKKQNLGPANKFESYQMQANVPNGKYIQWYLNTSIVRVEGYYKDGVPDGTWKLYNFDHTGFYELSYKAGKLLHIVLPPEIGEKVPPIEIAKHASKPVNGTFLGYVYPTIMEGIDYYSNASSFSKTFHHQFLFSDSSRKAISGIAIGDFRFSNNSVSRSADCDNRLDKDGSPEWIVFQKMNDSCLVQINSSEAVSRKHCDDIGLHWVKCDKYKNVETMYSGEVSLDASEFFDAPNGKKRKIIWKNPLQTNHHTVEWLESKTVNGELWVKIKFVNVWGNEDYDGSEGEAWVKFWKDGRPTFSGLTC